MRTLEDARLVLFQFLFRRIGPSRPIISPDGEMGTLVFGRFRADEVRSLELCRSAGSAAGYISTRLQLDRAIVCVALLDLAEDRKSKAPVSNILCATRFKHFENGDLTPKWNGSMELPRGHGVRIRWSELWGYPPGFRVRSEVLGCGLGYLFLTLARIGGRRKYDRYCPYSLAREAPPLRGTRRSVPGIINSPAFVSIF